MSDERVAFVGRDLLTADALQRMFADEAAFHVLGAFRSVAALEATLTASRGTVDVVVLDVGRGRAGGAFAYEAAALRRLAHVVILLCDALTPEIVGAAVAVHAHGVLLKSDGGARLLDAVRRIAGGGHGIFPDGWQELAARDALVRGRLAQLSDRQREVLALMAAGHRNEEIAAALHLSMNTVKFHVRGVLQVLEVRSRVDAARIFHGFSDLSP